MLKIKEKTRNFFAVVVVATIFIDPVCLICFSVCVCVCVCGMMMKKTKQKKKSDDNEYKEMIQNTIIIITTFQNDIYFFVCFCFRIFLYFFNIKVACVCVCVGGGGVNSEASSLCLRKKCLYIFYVRPN